MNTSSGGHQVFEGFDFIVNAIVGPEFPEAQEQEVRTAVFSVSADVRVARDSGDLLELMFRADSAVCTEGSSNYQLLPH